MVGPNQAPKPSRRISTGWGRMPMWQIGAVPRIFSETRAHSICVNVVLAIAPQSRASDAK
eukprot:scaffold9180_cov35-Tisochrysis_lutea.AAC.4